MRTHYHRFQGGGPLCGADDRTDADQNRRQWAAGEFSLRREPAEDRGCQMAFDKAGDRFFGWTHERNRCGSKIWDLSVDSEDREGGEGGGDGLLGAAGTSGNMRQDPCAERGKACGGDKRRRGFPGKDHVCDCERVTGEWKDREAPEADERESEWKKEIAEKQEWKRWYPGWGSFSYW